jgi:hypothetical protein
MVSRCAAVMPFGTAKLNARPSILEKLITSSPVRPPTNSATAFTYCCNRYVRRVACGIYIAGGIVPKLGAIFAQSEFRARFEAKGRMRSYLAAIPTYVITRPYPGLLGASALLRAG